MRLESMMNEIKLLKEYHNKQEYDNICKILKEMVAAPSQWIHNIDLMTYFITNLLYMIDNKPGTSDEDDIQYAITLLNDINSDFDENIQHQASIIMGNMFSILLHANKNHKVILQLLYMLCIGRPLTPLTDNADDWDEVGEYDGFKIFVHKRCDKVYKNERTGDITYLEGIIFVTEDGNQIVNQESVVELKLPSMLPEPKFVKI
jgi:hypothetical protein